MRKITIEVEAPDDFDDVEDRWEVEKAAQEYINANYERDDLPDPIIKFEGAYRFLSNFYQAPFTWRGWEWPTAEHAFQAAKTLDREEAAKIREAGSPGLAKRMGQRVALRSDWEKVKLDIMRQILAEKFTRPVLRSMLLATGEAELFEGNTWGDTFWGVCNGTGENHLGRLLMGLRNSLREE